MKTRALLGSFQLPVAGVGAVLLTGAVGTILLLPPAEGEGFVRGLAVLFLYVLAWSGFVVLSVGLAIPPSGGYGIQFGRRQRGLFVVAAIAAVGSAIGPFVAFRLFYTDTELLVYSLLGLAGLAVIALSGGLLWRFGEVVRTRMETDDPTIRE